MEVIKIMILYNPIELAMLWNPVVNSTETFI